MEKGKLIIKKMHILFSYCDPVYPATLQDSVEKNVSISAFCIG